MGRKLFIPLFEELGSRQVTAVRRRLGGRATSDAGIGELVRVAASSALGVVLFVQGDEIFVLTDESTVRKTTRGKTAPAPGEPDEALAALAADARVFATLREGQRVRYVDGSAVMAEGTLVEKCRYGAIVLRDDQTLMGVGFRKIWPAAALGGASS